MTGLENRESKKDTKMKVKSKGRRRREKNKRWKGKKKVTKRVKLLTLKANKLVTKQYPTGLMLTSLKKLVHSLSWG